MSSATVQQYRPLARPQQLPQTSPRPQLQVIPGGVKNRFAAPVSVFVATLLVAALSLTMFINTQMAATSFQMHRDQITLSKLANERAALVSAVQEANSPKKLAARAREAGLVPSGKTGYITLKDAQVVGGSPAE